MAKSKSLRGLILKRLIIPLILFVCLESILSYFVTLHYVDKTNDRWLLNSARALAQEIEVRNGQAQVELPPAALEIVKWNDYDKTYFKIKSRQRGLLAGEDFLPEPTDEVDWAQPVFFNASLHGEGLRLVAMRVTDAQAQDVIDVLVGETLYKRGEMMRDILLADLLPQLALVAFVGLYLLSGLTRGLKPLHDLAHEIAKRSPRDLSPIADKDIVPEVKTLTDTINALLQRLASAIAAQQRFIANAAHQLRTPLAGLNVQVARALQEDDVQAMKPALWQMRHSTERMAHTVSQLLVLAKAEPLEGGSELKPVDLFEITRSTCMEWAPKALVRNIELEFECLKHPVMVIGDNILLQEMIANLLDNAITYGRENGYVNVKLSNIDGPVLSVVDDGPGIPRQELPRIVERFYRIPGSTGEGCGLGLAIVKEIAVLHGARLEIDQCDAEGGLHVSVIFKVTDN